MAGVLVREGRPRKTARDTYYAAIDSEDDGKGNPYLFVCVHGKTRFARNTAKSFRREIVRLANITWERGERLVVWCTNLEYDLVNMFQEDIYELKLMFGKSMLVGAEWREHGIYFRDTVRHIPASVFSLGEMVGLKKIEDNRRGKKYAFRDASITLKSAGTIRQVYNRLGSEPKCTLPSTAFHIWRGKYWTGSNIELPNRDVLQAAKNSYYGGRTEPFSIGSFKEVTVIDAASMFPYCMLGKFPLPWGDYERVNKNQKIEAFGLYQVRIESNVGRPILPVRTERGTVFPNGTFVGWWTGEELLYYCNRRQDNGNVEVLRGYAFKESCEPFTRYVEDFFKLKQSSRGALREMYKLLLNGLYGKYGQKGEHIRAVPLADFYRSKYVEQEHRIWCGLALYLHKGEPPPWGNNVWSAFVTSRARIRLHREITRIQNHGARPLYCDTDSVIYIGTGPSYPERASNAGDFEVRGRYKEILIRGKKEYGLRLADGTWEPKVKGIPDKHREEYLFKGTATFQRPIRMREAARRNLKANEWRQITKTRKVSFKDRVVNEDGSLDPIILREN